MKDSIVITGLGTVSPAGTDITSFWKAVSAGKSLIKPVSGFDTSMFNSHNAAELADFDPREFIQRKSIKYLDKISRLSISAGTLALKDAGLEISPDNATEVGVVLGSMFGGWESIAEFNRQMLQYKMKRVNPLLFTNTVPNSPAGQMSIEFGIKGLNTSLSSGFASSTDAIGKALNYLQLGKVQAIIAGGAEELNPWIMGSFDKLDYLSNTKNKQGLFLGEGAAMLVLETVQHAQARKANVYAKISAYNSTYNSSSLESAVEQTLALALDEAKLKPSDINYINVEGSGFTKSDAAEKSAINNIFKESADKIPLSSIKPTIGHCLGAAGAFDAIACILSMKHNTIPPKIKKEVNKALSISLSPEGNCACLIFEKEVL